MDIINKILKGQSKMVTMDTEGMALSFLGQIKNGNDGVGTVTNMNTKQLALLFVLRDIESKRQLGTPLTLDEKKVLEITPKVFAKALKSNLQTVENYEPLMTEVFNFGDSKINVQKISFNRIDTIMRRARQMKMTLHNCILFLQDLNIVFRLYQEKIIDSAKTGDVIKLAIRLGDHLKASSLFKTSISIDWNDKTILRSDAKQNNNLTEEEIESGCYAFNDYLGNTRATLVNSYSDDIEKLINSYTVEFSTEDLTVFEIPFGKQLFIAMSELKLMYNDAASTIYNYSEDETAKMQYKAQLAALTSTVRLLTPDLSDANRGLLMKKIALATGKGVIQPQGTNKFAENVCQEEHVLMLTDKGFAEIDFCGTKIISNKTSFTVGDIIDLNGGIAIDDKGNIILAAEDINGSFLLKEVDSKLYATTLIKEQVGEIVSSGEFAMKLTGKIDKAIKDAIYASTEFYINKFKLYGKQGEDDKSTLICGVSIPAVMNTFLSKKAFSFAALHENVFMRENKEIVSYMLVVNNFIALSQEIESTSSQDEYGYSQGPMDNEALDSYLGIQNNAPQKQNEQKKDSSTNSVQKEFNPNGVAYSEKDLNSLLGLA